MIWNRLFSLSAAALAKQWGKQAEAVAGIFVPKRLEADPLFIGVVNSRINVVWDRSWCDA
jgi:hypothetical protein